MGKIVLDDIEVMVRIGLLEEELYAPQDLTVSVELEHSFAQISQTDDLPFVEKWSSESVCIPYMSPVDGKMHRYFVDNTVHIREGSKVVKYLIEIKPSKQTKPPSTHGNKKRSTMWYEAAQSGVNQAKWESAKRWASKNGYIFQIVTERDFNLFTR